VYIFNLMAGRIAERNSDPDSEFLLKDRERERGPSAVK
jgi:hypothetical protein